MSNNYFIGLTGSQAGSAARLLWEDYGFFELDFDFFKDNWGKALGEVKGSAHIVTPIRSDEEAAQVLGAGGVLVELPDDAGEAAETMRAFFAVHGEPELPPAECEPDEELSVAELFEEIDEHVSGLAFAVYDLLPRNRPDPIKETEDVLCKRLDDLRGRALGAPVAEVAATH